MEVNHLPLSPSLLLMVVAMVTELAGSSLAATTPFRFPANLAEAFQVDGASGLGEERALAKATPDIGRKDRASAATSGSGSTSGSASGGIWRAEGEPAAGRQHSNGNSQSYGTSWDNHYQSPTKSSSYDSRYEAPEKGDSNRHDDEGQRQYSYQDGDSDSGGYHSETPYGGGSYSGGTHHSGGGNYHGGGRGEGDHYGGGGNHYDGGDNHYGGGENHYGGGGSSYDGGRNNHDDGYGYNGGDAYGSGRNHNDEYGGGRNHNDEVTSYTRGDNHYGRGNSNEHGGGDYGYGGSGGDTNNYGGGGSHDGNDDGYVGHNRDGDYGRGGGHGGQEEHDEHGHGYGGQDSGYRGSEAGPSGHSEDPVDEYAIYSPKMSGTGRRRSDRGHGGYQRIFREQPKSPSGSSFDRSDTKSVEYNGKRSDGGRNGDQRRGEGVDRKDDFTDLSGSGKTQSLLEMINQRTEEAFGDPDSAAKSAEIEGKGYRGFTHFRGYDSTFSNNENYGGKRDSEAAMRYGKDFEKLRGSVGRFNSNAAKEDSSEYAPIRRPTGFEDFREPENLHDQPRYETQKHLVDDSSTSFGGFHIPDHIFKSNPFAGKRPNVDSAKEHQNHNAYQANDDAFFKNGYDQHPIAQSDSKYPGSQFDIHANNMFAKISNPFQSHGPGDSEHVGTSRGSLQNSNSMPHRSRYQEVEAMARDSADLPVVTREGSSLNLNETERKLVHNRTRRNTSVSDDANVLSRSSEEIFVRSSDANKLSTSNENQPRAVRPVIHRHFDGVPHMIHRDMGDEVFETSRIKSELPDFTRRDARRVRGGFHGSYNPALRHSGRRFHPNFAGQRSRHGASPLYPPLRGFAPSRPIGHRQRQQSRGVQRPAFNPPGPGSPSSGEPPLQSEHSGFSGRPAPQYQRNVFQHQSSSSHASPFRPNLQHEQLRSTRNGLYRPASVSHGAVGSPPLKSQRAPVQGHPVRFAGQQASNVHFQNVNGGIHETQQPRDANLFVDVQHPEHQEATTISSIIHIQGKQPDGRITDNLVDVDGSFDAFHARHQSKPELISGAELYDSITQASTVGETRREDKASSSGFKPGVLEHGFLPIDPAKHHISRRELSAGVVKVDPVNASQERSAVSGTDILARDTRLLSSGFPNMPADLLEFQSDYLSDKPALQKKFTSSSSKTSTTRTKLSPTPPDLSNTSSSPDTVPSNISLSSFGKATRSNFSTSAIDLALAESRQSAAYKPHYSNYKGRRGYRNYKTKQDPYQRYLPNEDENDPYFRYASRDNIQHSHADEVPPEETGGRRERHRDHDLHGRRGGQRGHSAPRHRHTERLAPDYDSAYDSDYESDYARERPRNAPDQRRSAGHGPGYGSDYDDGTYRTEPIYSQGRQNDYNYDDSDYASEDDYDDYGDHNDRHSSDNHYHDDGSSDGYHDDEKDGYHGDGRGGKTRRRNKDSEERYYDPGYQSGRYKEGDERGDYYGDQGDERIRDIDGEIRDEASRGYDDSRSTVSAMLDTIAEKRADANCKEVEKDGMTCFQCTDAKGFQTEDCAYASNSKDPNNRHVSYSESSSYGDSKRPDHDKGGKRRRKPVKKHQRDGGDTYGIDFNSDLDGIEVNSDHGAIYTGGHVGAEEAASHGRGDGFSGQDKELLTPEEETQRGRFQTPGAFKAGRFRDAYADRGHSRTKRHAGHSHVSDAVDSTPKNGDRLAVQDNSYTGRALARFLNDDQHTHDARLDSKSQRSRRYPGYPSDRPRSQRRSGGYHVRGEVPEYHRRVESSQSSGGGYDGYATGEPKRNPRPANDDPDYDDVGYGLGGESDAIGDVFDYRFGRQPIDGEFVERLEKERADEGEPVEYDDEYQDSERPEYEDPDAGDYPEYDYDYQEQGQEHEQERPAQRGSVGPDGSRDRYSHYEDERSTPLRRSPGRRTRHLRQEHTPFDDDRGDTYDSEATRRQRYGVESPGNTDSEETDHQSAEQTYRNVERRDSGDSGERGDGDDSLDRAATYNNDERHERRPVDARSNSAGERELARDMEPLNDEPAAYEIHRYDVPDVTRSYEVSPQRRPTLTDDLGTPRGYLHSDGASVSSRSEQGHRDGSGTSYGKPDIMKYDYARPETYEKLNRGSVMTRQYRDPGREFFRSHPVGFEYFPTFDYVEADKKPN